MAIPGGSDRRISIGPQSKIRGPLERKGSIIVPTQSMARVAKKLLPEMPVIDDKTIDFETIELFFFAYRDFISDPDAILAKIGYGRAHHRVVYFVSRRPGMTVADLLNILRITKQSLARVLKELIDSGYIRQMTGPADRRQRRLYPTLAGRELALALSEPQSLRIAQAFETLKPEMREGVKLFLQAMAGGSARPDPSDSETD
ncbi:MarR family transcriptional regulator [Rhizobium sp. CG5]|nr:MarR family transcriptional regulator [Rhizobium sp. CG5]